jgi:DUF1680 family protein
MNTKCTVLTVFVSSLCFALPSGRAETVLARRPPHAALQAVGLDQVRWTSGFWADRFDVCHRRVIPKMKEALLHPKNSACLSNFRVGSGIEQGAHRGVNWSDGDCYKWIEAMARIYAVTRDDVLDREMDYWINLIASTQAPDGYICTQTQLNPNKERWGMRTYHELYNMGHLMTAACVHHEATGKTTFLAVARQLADYLEEVFGPRPKELAHFGWNPSNIMGLVDLYRATGEARYLKLAGIFVDMRGTVKWGTNIWGDTQTFDPHPGDQNQNRVPLREESQAVGHAVTATYLYCGATDVVAETGDQTLRDALERIWRDMTEKKMYVTGAIGAHHHTVSIRHDKVHEAFGAAYDLPNRTAYNETCANIGNAMWNWRMLQVSGEAKYADVMERVLYNSALSPMNIEGTRFCYANPLERRQGMTGGRHDTLERWSVFTCYCCPPSVARMLAKTHTWAYGMSADAVWIHLYGSSSLETTLPDGGTVCLAQKTDYPWDGSVTVSVEKAPVQLTALRLRIPAWADQVSIRVNGEAIEGDFVPGAYYELRRAWASGDVVELDLPMEVVLIEAHPRVEAARNRVAIMRGPVVYCLESADLAEGVDIDNVSVPRYAKWTAYHAPNLLGGVTVLETTALVRSDSPMKELYRRLPKKSAQSAPLRLVPYYAWNNRGSGDMAVWLPVE